MSSITTCTHTPGFKWPIYVMLMCWASGTWSQPDIIRFKRFTDDEGLPNNLYQKVIQDSKGVIWMAGNDGIARYDGYTIKPFRHSHKDSNSISGNHIISIFEDSKGRLWLGALGSGLNISNPEKMAFRKLPFPENPKDLPNANVRAITEDKEAHTWIGSDIGLYIATEEGNKIKIVPFEVFAQEKKINTSIPEPRALLTDPSGRVWIGTIKGLYMYDPAQKKIYQPGDFKGLPANIYQDIVLDLEGRIWVSCHQGARLYYSSLSQIGFRPFDKITFSSPTRDLHFNFDHDNRLWITILGEQAFGYDFRDSTLFLNSKANSNIVVERFFRKPFIDNSGNTWLPVEGFNIYPYPKGFKTYLHPFTFHQSNTCIFGLDSMLYIGYREKGFVMVNRYNGDATHFSTDDEINKITANHLAYIIKVRSGNLVVVSFGNISVITPKGKVLASYEVRGTQRSAYEDKAGRIWIGGIQGMHLFSEVNGIIKTYSLPVEGDNDPQYIQSIVEDKSGRIWFASELKSLCVLDPRTEKITQFVPIEGKENSIPSVSVVDMAVDKEYKIWLATDVALVHFDPETGSFQSYDRSNGLENDFIAAVLCTADGMIWMTTHSGISSFDPVTKKFSNYNKSDGLSNAGYYRRSKFDDGNGTLYFGGKNGVDYFRPAELRTNPSAPRLFISNLLLNNKNELALPVPASGKAVELSYKNQLLEIEMAAVHPAEQSEIEYEYQMQGVSDDWVKLGSQRKVLFSGLRPGHYIFRGKATSGDGIASTDELIIPIHIAPPFYLTRWFQVSGGFLLLLSLFTIIKGREKNIKRKEKQEAEFNRKMTELEKRALQAQMNPHFIYNSMNSIQQFMIIHDIEGAMKYLTKFSRILRTVLTISSQNRIPLYDELKLIEDYLELENMRFPDKFTYVIQVSPDCNIHAVEIPPFFIQPQVENAIRHGLLKKSTQGHLRIEIFNTEHHLHVTVEDNGIGREAAKAAKHRSGVVEESKGLGILQERLAHLHPKHDFKPFKIIDLYDNNHQPAGTRVEITLPLD